MAPYHASYQMPIIRNIAISDHSTLGVWKITESIKDLTDQAILTPSETAIYRRFKSVSRQKEWLAVRVLLNQLLYEKFQITYQRSGKPEISGHHSHLSISHTNDYAGIILNRKFQSGLDLQVITPKLERIRQRFLNPIEEEWYLSNGSDLYLLHLIWGAKEVLFKIHGDHAFFFKEHLAITPVKWNPKGSIKASISNHSFQEHYTLNYEILDKRMLVYVAESIPL